MGFVILIDGSNIFGLSPSVSIVGGLSVLLLLGLWSTMLKSRRSWEFSKLHKTIQCPSNIKVCLRSVSSEGMKGIWLSDIFSDRKWYAIITPETIEGALYDMCEEETLYGKLCGAETKSSMSKVTDYRKAETNFTSARKALQTKSWTVTKRNWVVVVVQILFPLGVYCVFHWLEYGLFWKYRWEEMCGEFIYNAADCKEKGFNLTCIKPLRSA